ncbi:MAG: hypothetical protein WB817_17600 [Terriglobales bacterium]
MKVVLLAVALSLPFPRLTPPAKLSPVSSEQPVKHKGGRWYFAANGHAVYCYGPVVTLPQPDGFVKVATFCRGDQTMVPLKD